MKKHNAIMIAVFGSMLLSACAPKTYVERQRNISSDASQTVNYSCSNLKPNIRTDAPRNYIVKRGDTLWDISARYLHNPWAWRALWQANPQIRNPHLIYPGDELILEGSSLRVVSHSTGQRRGGLPVVRLSPGVEETPLDMGIPVIEARSVQSFLTDNVIVNPQDIQFMPYVLELQGAELMSNIEKRIYVQGTVRAAAEYDTYRKGGVLTDPFTNKVIGVEMLKTGSVVIERAEADRPSSAFVKSVSTHPLVRGDYLVPASNYQGVPNLYFDPIPAPRGTEAQILQIESSLSSVAVGRTVIISKGLNAGLQPGSVLLAQTSASYTTDPVTGKKVALPSEARGTVMVYKVFDETSYAIVTQAQEPIRIGSWVTAPDTGCLD